MKTAKLLSRLIIGIVFIFSGFVKAVDPLGTVYKFGDYLNAFNLSFLTPLCLFLAVILCAAEFMSGISLLFNIKPKLGIWVVMLMMIIFTPLTLVLALTNPVSDCGCFGDAIHLTNWQTFIKNIIILIPAIFLFTIRKKMADNMDTIREWAVIVIVSFFFFLFILFNLRYLPVIDFLPYKTGTYIPDKMIIPEGMPVDQYKTTFIYEKNGTEQEFSLEDYPANDTTWKFVDSRTVLVSKGYEPPIHDLIFSSETGEDKTEQVLSSSNYTLLMISKKLDEVKDYRIEEGIALGKELKSMGIDFYLLTSSSANNARKYFEPNNSADFFDSLTEDNFFLVDEITLKTMVRSNPGYMLIRNGTIIDKWSWARIPDIETLNKITNK